MQLRHYSSSTVKTYLHCLKQYLAFAEAQQLEPSEVSTAKAFLHGVVRRKLAKSTVNQYINAIKYYLEHFLQQEKQYFYELERPIKDRRLPKVLSKEEVKAILRCTQNLKHRAILSLLYAQGLRIGEALDMKLSDVDSQRMVLHIRKGKGCKDRDVPLSPKILELLRNYYKAYKPKDHLFEGASGGRYTESSVRQFLARSVHAARIHKHVTTHMLRHSYATHLLESNIDIRYIKELLGHGNIRTTEVYLHVTANRLQNIASPFDTL